MSDSTVSSMHDARDAEDRALLEAGDHTGLLAAYLHGIRERCAVRIRDPHAAEDVAQTIVLRLWDELERGLHRGRVPFRVVVWKVTGWTIGGHFTRPGPDTVELGDWDGATEGDLAEWEERHDLGLLAEGLPERSRQMFEAVYLRGLTSGEAAAELGLDRNAGYQALHRAHRALAGRLDGG